MRGHSGFVLSRCLASATSHSLGFRSTVLDSYLVHHHQHNSPQQALGLWALYSKQDALNLKPTDTLQCSVKQHCRGQLVCFTVTGKRPQEFALHKHKEEAPDPNRVVREDEAHEDPGAYSYRVKEFVRRLKTQLQATFLPAGYPRTVGPHYLEFAAWQAVTNFATTANGVLASTFLLYSVGLGHGAIATAGALNWVLKDGLGQMGTLLFGKAIAHNFDIHSKTWYFLSCVMLSAATGLEIATILLPKAFLVLGSLANMVKGLSWMAGGSTRSVFNLSFVRDNNIADITAKGTSQYIFASLFGTAAGVSMCSYIGQTPSLALATFTLLAYVALYSAYRTVKSIPLPTLNSTRLQLLAEKYLRCIVRDQPPLPDNVMYINYQKEYAAVDDDGYCELNLPSPVELADQDPPLFWVHGDQRIMNPVIKVGTPLEQLLQGNPSLLVVLMTTFKYSRYLVLPADNCISIVLHQDAQARDMVQAFLQACMLRKRLKDGFDVNIDNIAELRIILHDTLLTSQRLTAPFMDALLRRGWMIEKIVVEAHKKRAIW